MLDVVSGSCSDHTPTKINEVDGTDVDVEVQQMSWRNLVTTKTLQVVG